MIKNSTIEPMGDRVLVLPNEADEFFDQDAAQLLARPGTSKERPQEATVLAVGPLVKDPRLKPGVQVFYGKFSGSELTVDRVELAVLLEEDLLGVVNPEASIETLIAAAGRSVPKPKSEPSSIIQTA